jgi:hypothetical protein
MPLLLLPPLLLLITPLLPPELGYMYVPPLLGTMSLVTLLSPL